MALKNPAIISIFLAALILCHISNATAADPPGLINLRTSHLNSKKTLLTSYLQQLVALEKNLLNDNNITGANAVRQELKIISGEIGSIPSPQVQAAVPVVPVPAARPVIKKRTPRTHVSETRGLAGAPKFSENNVYTFNIPDVGNSSSLTIWATGRRSIDSFGNVWLITPSGQREKITKWKDRHFDEPSTEISSYKKLNPITEDISNLVTRPGYYKVEFEWTDGVDPLVIFRVEITS